MNMHENKDKAYRFLHIDHKEQDPPAKAYQLFTHQHLAYI